MPTCWASFAAWVCPTRWEVRAARWLLSSNLIMWLEGKDSSSSGRPFNNLVPCLQYSQVGSSQNKNNSLGSWSVLIITICFFPGACGGALMTGDTPRFLFSPGWPELYQPNLECSWVIRSPNSIVEFNLLSLDIEDEVSCLHDSLVIRDGRLSSQFDIKYNQDLSNLCYGFVL